MSKSEFGITILLIHSKPEGLKECVLSFRQQREFGTNYCWDHPYGCPFCLWKLERHHVEQKLYGRPTNRSPEQPHISALTFCWFTAPSALELIISVILHLKECLHRNKERMERVEAFRKKTSNKHVYDSVSVHICQVNNAIYIWTNCSFIN